MTSLRDPQTCRRALREIGEIAAVAGLEGAQMTDQEALQSIAAIAEWVLETAPGARADCGEVVRRLERMKARENRRLGETKRDLPSGQAGGGRLLSFARRSLTIEPPSRRPRRARPPQGSRVSG